MPRFTDSIVQVIRFALKGFYADRKHSSHGCGIPHEFTTSDHTKTVWRSQKWEAGRGKHNSTCGSSISVERCPRFVKSAEPKTSVLVC